MAPSAAVTSKGQVTIPKSVRDHLGVKAGDRIRFVVEKDGRVSLAPATYHIKDLVGVLPPPKRRLTLRELDDAVLGAVAERHRERSRRK